VKVKPLLPAAVSAAREVLALADVRRASDIDIEAIAARLGVMVLYGPVATARGSLVRAGRYAIVHVDERARGQGWGDFTTAHEVGHFKMHPEADHFTQCESEDDARARGGEKQRRGGSAWRIEKEANHFSTELRMPESLAAPLCAAPHPTLDDVARLVRTFPTSLTSAGLRYTQLTSAPCAWTLSVGGRVRWASESLTFPGRIVMGRLVHPRSVAAALRGERASDAAPREVPGEAWGGEGSFVEQAIGLGPKGGVLSWIVPAA
jgi:hypothetical protein